MRFRRASRGKNLPPVATRPAILCRTCLTFFRGFAEKRGGVGRGTTVGRVREQNVCGEVSIDSFNRGFGPSGPIWPDAVYANKRIANARRIKEHGHCRCSSRYTLPVLFIPAAPIVSRCRIPLLLFSGRTSPFFRNFRSSLFSL